METGRSGRPSVVIVGAGFGGLRVARSLRDAPVDVTVIDRNNYHLFVPLLYQVATAGLEAEEIAQPVRRLFHKASNVSFLLASAQGLDLERRVVVTDRGKLPYDLLVLAAGSTTHYFGMESLERSTCALRTLDEAERLRDRLLSAFESAAAESDRERRRQLMTLVVIGGGPTGVELAGALAELRRHVLPRDYRQLDLADARIVLLEASDRLLPGFPARSRDEARVKLHEMGVDVRLRARVTNADERGVTLESGERIAAGGVSWVAGMRAPPLADVVPAPKGASGRLIVEETLQLPGHPEVYAIGDMVHVGGPEAPPHPMMAPVAIQQGDLVAENIKRHLAAQPAKRFRYKNRGVMVTIGRQAAVAQVYGLEFGGFFAWVLWLTVHLFWLIGFRNRALVLVNWAWNYLTYDRGVRLIRRRA